MPSSKSTSQKKLPHVGILVETDDTWGRNVVEAVCRHARKLGWTLLIGPRDSQGRLRLPKVWNGHGVIASLRTSSSVRHVKRLKVPVVDVSMMVPKYDWLARVSTDDQARATMALEHLFDRGLRHFACYAPPIGRYSDSRSRAFAKAVEGSGYHCAMYQSERDESVGWLTNYANVRQWLHELPRPLGVFAADPYPARQLVEICAMESIRIPDEISILSGDNDDLLCNVAFPQISAIELASHRIGETAADCLAKMMRGGAIPKRTQLIRPLQILSRHSTDVLAIDDQEIAEVLNFIRDHAATGITVRDVLNEFAISRRSLEMRFLALIGRSPAKEIRRIRIEYVRRTLLDSERTIGSIATHCGFASAAALSQFLQKHTGQSPSQLRASQSRN